MPFIASLQKHAKQIGGGLETRGKRFSIACMSWTTATGDIQPISFKYQDSEGIVNIVKDIHVRMKEDCVHYGDPVILFYCNASMNDCLVEFRLIYFRIKGIWEMYIGN